MIKNRTVREIILIVIGTFLMSISINLFYEPNNLITGGVTGLAIVIEKVAMENFALSIPIWLTNLVLNVPLFILGIKVNGKRFLLKTLFSTLLLSLWLYVTKYFAPVTYDLNLAAIFGGCIGGIGLGLVFLAMSTTGGSDLAANIIHRYIKHIALSKILFTIDSCVIAVGFFKFGAEKAMYAIIAVFICSKIIDTILEGFSFAKAAFIISDYANEISQNIFEKLGRGATSLSGEGMYTGQPKNVVLCVVAKKEIVILKELVSNVDKRAFVIVADVREVLGEGFNEE